MTSFATARRLVSSWRGRFIVVFVLVQLLVPLHYYIRHRDKHDERFAWRMFSPIRMVSCTPRFVVAGKVIEPRNEFHEAWQKIAERGRFVVIEAMGRELCTRYPKSPVIVDLTCTNLDKSTESYGGYDICEVPNL